MLKVKFYCTHLKLGSRRSNQNFKHFEFLLYKKLSKTPKTTCTVVSVYIHVYGKLIRFLLSDHADTQFSTSWGLQKA